MRYNNPLQFLAGAAAASRFVNAFSRRAIFCVLAMLVFATLSYAKPPQAPPVQPVKFSWAVTTSHAPACTNCPCTIDDCPCGCCDGKACTCRKKRVNELAKPYAKQWMAEGWTWNEAGGYWFKYPEVAVQPQYAPQQMMYQPPQMQFMPSFGGGGFGGGGGGGCSS
jgi:hypothetical protein